MCLSLSLSRWGFLCLRFESTFLCIALYIKSFPLCVKKCHLFIVCKLIWFKILKTVCCLSSRARARACVTRDSITRTRVKEKHSDIQGPCGPLWPQWPVLNSHKLRVISGFIQLISNLRTVNIMGKRVCRHCPIPGCHSKFLVRLVNHLA